MHLENLKVLTESNSKDISELYSMDHYSSLASCVSEEEHQENELIGRSRLPSKLRRELFNPFFDDEDTIAQLLVHLSRTSTPFLPAEPLLETPRVSLKLHNSSSRKLQLKKSKKAALKRKKDVRIPNACSEHKRKHQKCPMTCKNRLHEDVSEQAM